MDPETKEEFALMSQQVVDLSAIRANYVTKADLTEVEARMEVRIAQLEIRLVKWFVGSIFSSAVVSFSLAVTILKVFG